ELRDWLQFLECRRKRIRQTPDGRRPEFLVLRLEVQIMHGTSEMFRRLQSALDKRLVDGHLGSNICQFTSLPGLHLLSHRLEVSLHSVNTNRDAVDQRERLRVFRENRREHA